MPNRKLSSEAYRYGFNGHEKDNEIKGEGNEYSTQYRQYDCRIGRWTSLDPILKQHESPYAAFSNNPVWFVDIDGRDTLVMNTIQIKSPVDDIRITKVTFSVISNGIERQVTPTYPKGVKHKNNDPTAIYFIMNETDWRHDNIWYSDNPQESEMFSVRFESYKSEGSGRVYKNAIRIKYIGSTRILAHYGESSTWTKGCQVTGCSYMKATPFVAPRSSQEALDAVRGLHDLYIPSEQKTNKFGKKVSVPKKGYDFMIRTNSLPQETPKPIQQFPIDTNVSPEMDNVKTTINHPVAESNEN